MQFQPPESIDKAKAILRRAKKYKKRAQVERDDAMQSGYTLGVKVQSEYIAEYDEAIAFYTQWLDEHADDPQAQPKTFRVKVLATGTAKGYVSQKVHPITQHGEITLVVRTKDVADAHATVFALVDDFAVAVSRLDVLSISLPKLPENMDDFLDLLRERAQHASPSAEAYWDRVYAALNLDRQV